jgi:uncharacterized membrane protein
MTQQQMDRLDRLVEDYLGAVSWACGDIDPQRRDELVEELREHITAARGALYQQTEAAVRTILDRLGEPAVIAEEARLGEPGQPAAPAPEPRERRRLSRGTLGMWLGFFLIVLVILAGVALVMLMSAPMPPSP